MTMLRIEGVTKSFGGFRALSDIHISVAAGERRAIIGPNGAGKSTLFNVIAGQLKPTAGRVAIKGEDVTGLPPYEMWKRGMVRTFQRNTVFPKLTVLENVRLPVLARRKLGRRLFDSPARHAAVDDEARVMLRHVNLDGRAHTLASDLAYGEQRQLELAIALAGGPSLLLLDEPTAGMSPAETKTMVTMLAQLPRTVTLLVVEHDMDVVFALADSVTVLNMGEVLAEGPPAQIEKDEHVSRIYLGRSEGSA